MLLFRWGIYQYLPGINIYSVQLVDAAKMGEIASDVNEIWYEIEIGGDLGVGVGVVQVHCYVIVGPFASFYYRTRL